MKRIPLELLLWISALVYLALIDPSLQHMSLCVFRFLGLTWCPGCGIGHAISYALHGDFAASVNAHFFGIPAVIILLHRIFVLAKNLIAGNLITTNISHY
jgi:Protein of unknown function (DUF2752)